jgi:hypothetical protein
MLGYGDILTYLYRNQGTQMILRRLIIHISPSIDRLKVQFDVSQIVGCKPPLRESEDRL